MSYRLITGGWTFYCWLQIPPPVPLRLPAVPKRTHIPPSIKLQPNYAKMNIRPQTQQQSLPRLPPATKARTLPPIPPVNNKPKPPIRNQASIDASNINNIKKMYDLNRNASIKQPSFEYNNVQEIVKIPKAPLGPPPPAPNKICHNKSNPPASKIIVNQQCNNPTTGAGGRVSIRQDSSVSSDSFSQTSSPSYTTKTMETPLLPPKEPLKHQNGHLVKVQNVEEDPNGNTTITKSASTPASLQTIVRFHNGSNMSLHHRVTIYYLIPWNK